MNFPCQKDKCGVIKDENRKREPRLFTKIDSIQEKINNKLLQTLIDKIDASMIVPIDIDEDGRIDIVMQNRKSSHVDLQVIYNNVYLDSYFFIKTMMLYDTVEEEEVESESYLLLDKPKPRFGKIVSGASFRFVMTPMDDNKVVMAGSQLVSSSYGALLPPYLLLGIGDSINYIE
jgi:hypothetical protein